MSTSFPWASGQGKPIKPATLTSRHKRVIAEQGRAGQRLRCGGRRIVASNGSWHTCAPRGSQRIMASFTTKSLSRTLAGWPSHTCVLFVLFALRSDTKVSGTSGRLHEFRVSQFGMGQFVPVETSHTFLKSRRSCCVAYCPAGAVKVQGRQVKSQYVRQGQLKRRAGR